MPLPPIADTFSDRYWLKYTSDGEEHEMCYRVPSSTSTATGIAHANALATALKPYIRTTDAFNALRYSEAGSSISFPLAWASVAGTLGSAPAADYKVSFFSMVGRSAAGYRCRITFFSPTPSNTDGFRHSTATAGVPTALYTAVTGLSPSLVAKDGGGVIWNAYVNSGWNAYWQRRLR